LLLFQESTNNNKFRSDIQAKLFSMQPLPWSQKVGLPTGRIIVSGPVNFGEQDIAVLEYSSAVE
jgi:hypothetical protein